MVLGVDSGATAPDSKVSRDHKEDIVLACAIKATADVIISGDNDLLSLFQYRDIPILTAPQALHSLP